MPPNHYKKKIYFDLDDLETYGNELQEPKVRDLGNGLRLRTTAKNCSGFLFHIVKQIFYLTHAIQKKPQKTPKQDLMLAIRMKQLKNN